MLVQVRAPHFCAAIVLTNGIVTDAAPILAWTLGKRRADLSTYFQQKGWRAVIVSPLAPIDDPVHDHDDAEHQV
jgi:hypothetical protein